jgi:putative NADH-flavin reductase
MKLAILGATGRTGRLVVEQALAAGHDVRALVRSPDKLALRHERLELVQGDATDAAAVARMVDGADVVISALGPVAGRKDICSVAAGHVIAAGARRYVAVSGAGIDVPGDQKDFVGKLVSFLVRTLSPAVFHDKVLEHTLLARSSVPWVLVRPPRLVDKPSTGNPRMSLERSPGASVARADLAAFVLRCAGDESLTGKAPFVAS